MARRRRYRAVLDLLIMGEHRCCMNGVALFVAMSGVLAGGCTTQTSGCTGAAIDYASSTTGAPSARTALTAYVVHASEGLPRGGWRVSSSRTNSTEFRSGAATVEVSRFPGGWNVTGYKTC